jgi:hypothetical protein
MNRNLLTPKAQLRFDVE